MERLESGGVGGGVWISAIDLFGHAPCRSHPCQRHHWGAATGHREFGGSDEQTETVLGLLAVRCHRHWFGVGFALLRSGQSGLHLQAADLLLLGAMAFAAVGYAWGGRMSQSMGPEQVICWALVLSLPLTLPLAWFSQPTQAAPWSAWAGFAYVSLFSMWLGFFAWYRGLAMGGTVRVSQIQLLQPFLGMLIAIPVLGEGLDATTVSFGLAVVATVFISRKMPVQR